MNSHSPPPPEWASHFPLVHGIWLEGCVYQPARHCNEWAHAHFLEEDTKRGVICFTNGDTWDDEFPNPLFLHEYAHLMNYQRQARENPNSRRGIGHSIHWKRFFSDLLVEWGYPFIEPKKLRARGIPAPLRGEWLARCMALNHPLDEKYVKRNLKHLPK